MKIFLTHIRKNIAENKFRSISIILIVALSVFVSFVAFSLQDVIDQTYTNVYNASVGNANVTLESKDEAYFDYINVNLESIDIVNSSPIYDLSGRTTLENTLQKVVLRGVDLDSFSAINGVSLVTPPKSHALGQNEGIISLTTAKKYSLVVGDTLEVFHKEKPLIIMIVGIGQTDRTFYEEKGNIQILMSLDSVNEINKTSNYASKLRLEVANLDSSILEQLQYENPHLLVYEGEEFETLHFQMQSVSGAMFLTMSIVLIISAYIIFSIVKIIMLDRTKAVGTFRSIGANKNQIFLLLLVEFFGYGIIGSSVGYLVGLLGLPAIADTFNQYKEFGVVTSTSYSLWYGIASIAIGLILPVLVATALIQKENKKTLKNSILQLNEKTKSKSRLIFAKATISFAISWIIYCLNQSDKFILGLITVTFLIIGSVYLVQSILMILAALLGKSNKLSGSILIGIRNVGTNQYAFSNSSMIVSITLIFTIILTIVLGIQNTAQMDLDSYGFDIIAIVNNSEVTEAEIESEDGIAGAFSSYEVMAFGDYANGYCRVYGIDDFQEMNEYMKAIHYSEDNLNNDLSSVENGIVIDKYWAQTQNISIGDTVTLFRDEVRSQSFGTFEVAALWDCSKGTTDRVFVGVNINVYKRIFESKPERILVKTDENPENIANMLREKYIDTELSISTTEEFLAQQLNTVNTILSLLMTVIVLAGIVIIVGIASNLIVSFRYLKHDYAILYSTGMNKVQIKTMIITETIISYFAIVATIIALCTPLVGSLPKLTSGLGLIINYDLPPIVLVAVLFTTALIVLLTTTVPIRKFSTLNIVEELKYE